MPQQEATTCLCLLLLSYSFIGAIGASPTVAGDECSTSCRTVTDTGTRIAPLGSILLQKQATNEVGSGGLHVEGRLWSLMSSLLGGSSPDDRFPRLKHYIGTANPFLLLLALCALSLLIGFARGMLEDLRDQRARRNLFNILEAADQESDAEEAAEATDGEQEGDPPEVTQVEAKAEARSSATKRLEVPETSSATKRQEVPELDLVGVQTASTARSASSSRPTPKLSSRVKMLSPIESATTPSSSKDPTGTGRSTLNESLGSSDRAGKTWSRGKQNQTLQVDDQYGLDRVGDLVPAGSWALKYKVFIVFCRLLYLVFNVSIIVILDSLMVKGCIIYYESRLRGADPQEGESLEGEIRVIKQISESNSIISVGMAFMVGVWELMGIGILTGACIVKLFIFLWYRKDPKYKFDAFFAVVVMSERVGTLTTWSALKLFQMVHPLLMKRDFDIHLARHESAAPVRRWAAGAWFGLMHAAAAIIGLLAFCVKLVDNSKRVLHDNDDNTSAIERWFFTIQLIVSATYCIDVGDLLKQRMLLLIAGGPDAVVSLPELVVCDVYRARIALVAYENFWECGRYMSFWALLLTLDDLELQTLLFIEDEPLPGSLALSDQTPTFGTARSNASEEHSPALSDASSHGESLAPGDWSPPGPTRKVGDDDAEVGRTSVNEDPESSWMNAPMVRVPTAGSATPPSPSPGRTGTGGRRVVFEDEESPSRPQELHGHGERPKLHRSSARAFGTADSGEHSGSTLRKPRASFGRVRSFAPDNSLDTEVWQRIFESDDVAADRSISEMSKRTSTLWRLGGHRHKKSMSMSIAKSSYSASSASPREPQPGPEGQPE